MMLLFELRISPKIGYSYIYFTIQTIELTIVARIAICQGT